MAQFKSVNIVYLLLCMCISDIKISTQWPIDDEGCITPDGGVGDCIPIKQCKPIINFLKNSSKPISQDARNKLNNYTCNYEENSVKVCCPDTPISNVEQMPQTSVRPDVNTEIPPPPDIKNHKNFNLLPTDCGYLPLGDKVSNGKNANLNEFPWMALLSYSTSKGPEFKCGGSIINDKWILTAAHCLSSLVDPLLGVRVGEYNIEQKQDCQTLQDGSKKCADPVQDLAIEEVVVHPQFNGKVITNDIGLLRVTKINLNVENARPVCLPIDSSRNSKYKSAIVTGWGLTGTRSASSNILQKVRLPIVSVEQCQSVYKKDPNAHVSFRNICAGGRRKKDSCRGDSGGPLQMVASLNDDEPRYVQQGIVSFGPNECGLTGFPGVYTKVAYYMDWILDTIKP